MFTGPTLSAAGFCTMNGFVLFLILHMYTDAKDTNSSKKDIELKYRYLIGHKASQYHTVKLSVVYFKQSLSICNSGSPGHPLHIQTILVPSLLVSSFSWSCTVKKY